MASLPDNLVDIIVGQFNIFLGNACLLGVFLGGNINVDQAAARGFRAFAVLPLVRLVNNDGKLAPAERLHIFLGKQELLDRADDDALFVVDSLCQRVGVFLVVDGFHQADLMIKAVDSVLQLAVQHNAVGYHDDRIKDAVVLCIVDGGQPVGDPRNGVGLARTRRVLDQVVLPVLCFTSASTLRTTSYW